MSQGNDQYIWVRLSWNVGAKDISQSREELISEDFNVFGRTGPETWNLLLVPPCANDTPHVGLFLLYRGEQPTKTNFELVVLNKCYGDSVRQYYRDVNFECDKARNGSYDFILADQLLDPSQGFITEGKITIILQLPTVRDGFEWMLEQEDEADRWIIPVVEISDDDVVEISDEDVVDISDDDVLEISDEVVDISDDEVPLGVPMVAVTRRSPQQVTTAAVPSCSTAMPHRTIGGRSRGPMGPTLHVPGIARPTMSRLRQPSAGPSPKLCPPKQHQPTSIPLKPSQLKQPLAARSQVASQIPAAARSQAASQIPAAARSQIPAATRLKFPAAGRVQCPATKPQAPLTTKQQIPTKTRPQASPPYNTVSGRPLASLVAQSQMLPVQPQIQKLPHMTVPKPAIPKHSPPRRCVEPIQQATIPSRPIYYDTAPLIPTPAVPSRPLCFDTTPLMPTSAPCHPPAPTRPHGSRGHGQQSNIAYSQAKMATGCLMKFARR